jgi:hypothetical protein
VSQASRTILHVHTSFLLYVGTKNIHLTSYLSKLLVAVRIARNKHKSRKFTVSLICLLLRFIDFVMIVLKLKKTTEVKREPCYFLKGHCREPDS